MASWGVRGDAPPSPQCLLSLIDDCLEQTWDRCQLSGVLSKTASSDYRRVAAPREKEQLGARRNAEPSQGREGLQTSRGNQPTCCARRRPEI